MNDFSEVECKLDELVANEDYQNTIFTNLKQGDIIPKSGGLAYLIDDVTLPNKLENHIPGTVPYKQICNKFSGGKQEILEMFDKHGSKQNDITIMPYSKAFEENIEECVGRAILTQLCAQTNRKSYYINGLICIPEEGIEPLTDHGFNIIIKDEIPHLVDTTNPILNKEKNSLKPCIIPILDIKECGEIILDSKPKDNRKYFLF